MYWDIGILCLGAGTKGCFCLGFCLGTWLKSYFCLGSCLGTGLKSYFCLGSCLWSRIRDGPFNFKGWEGVVVLFLKKYSDSQCC